MTKEVVVDFGHWGECKVEVDDINEGVRVWWVYKGRRVLVVQHQNLGMEVHLDHCNHKQYTFSCD